MKTAAIALLIAAALAGAGDAAADQAAAKKHFDAGRRLMKAGKFRAACAEFAASHRAHASVGALLNIGECNERQNKLASAWRAFNEGAREARDQNDRKRARYARQRIARLEERLSFIELEVAGDTAALPGLVIELDGAPVDPDDFNRAIAADTGEHVVTARAEGRRPFRTEVAVDGERSRVKLRVVLEAAPAPAAPLEPPSDPEPRPSTRASPAKDDSPGMSGRRKAALASFAAAAVLAGGGTALGLSARSRWNDASACEATSSCAQADVDLADSARWRAHLSTGAFALAGAGLAAGLWLYLAGDEPEPDGVRVAVEPGAVWLMSRF